MAMMLIRIIKANVRWFSRILKKILKKRRNVVIDVDSCTTIIWKKYDVCNTNGDEIKIKHKNNEKLDFKYGRK